MSILQNAIDSIVIGVEDYHMDDKKRLLSSTRNIYAGVLLLFKAKLSQSSPIGSDEVLIKQKILPQINNESLTWIGKGKKTVDFQQIKERLESLNIKVDWNRLEKINVYRNNIEHYYSIESESAVKGMISNLFLIIRNFISDYLDEDPKELLGKETWEKLIQINEVYQSEKRNCIKEIDTYFDNTLVSDAINKYNCDNCFSELISVNLENELICKSCEKKFEEDELIEKALIEEYGNYDFAGGEEEKLILCPYCKKKTYLISENSCQICNETLSTECHICGTNISVNELNENSLCSSCSYMIDKNSVND